MQRFKSEFEKLPDSIKFEVLVSLKVKSDRLGIPLKYVWDDKSLTEIENKMGFREKYRQIKEFADKFNKNVPQ